MRLLVTGGAGFIGANFVRSTLAQRPDVAITVLDALTYAGSRESLAGVDSVTADIRLVDYRDVEGRFDRVASIERARVVVTTLRRRADVSMVEVPGGNHAMLRGRRAFEDAAAEHVVTHLPLA